MEINTIVITGRLTRNAELKMTVQGQAMCKFSIAVNYKKRQGEKWIDEADFFDVVVWGRQAESLNQYLVKGKTVGIEGKLRQEKWKEDGFNKSKVGIVANTIKLFGDNSNLNEDVKENPVEKDDGFSEDIPF